MILTKRNETPKNRQIEIKKEFLNRFKSLTGAKQDWQVWADFIESAAIAISSAMDRVQYKKRMERHQQIISGYDREQQSTLGRMYALVVEALNEEPEQDFLGSLYMELGLSNHWKGQFFTPYSICRMMASTQLEDAAERIARENWISINDPACGAGATLIAARNELKRQRVDWPAQVVFIAQDIDYVTGLMCYVQLSLLGCAGYVVIADTISDPLLSRGGSVLLPSFTQTQSVWFMPAYFTEPWLWRMLGAQMDLAFKGIPDQIPAEQSLKIGECEK